jgi:hypothetical protein
VIPRHERAQVSKAGRHFVEDRVFGDGRHVLIQTRDAQAWFPPDRSAVGWNLTRHHPQQAALAGAIPADESNPLTALDLEIGSFEQWQVTEGEPEALECKERHV